MSRAVSMRLQESQMERLQRLARRLGCTPSETSALLVEEALRRAEFAHIHFRNSAAGRQAHVQGTNLAVWEVILVTQAFDMDPARTAAHLNWPRTHVEAALNYAAAYPEEIETALADNEALDFLAVQRMLPQAERFQVEATA